MYNLDSDFEVQGIIEPGAELTTITKTVKKEVKLLTKNDVIVIWGGTRDGSKNETTSGMRQLKDFFRENNHTNIIQMGIPYRFDLHANSCVNKEIEVCNRKLGKLVKAFEYTALIKPDSNREVFTKHGLHMNNKGKELVTKKITSAIKHILDKK
jgi:lysophospholipase L1-like esterase